MAACSQLRVSLFGLLVALVVVVGGVAFGGGVAEAHNGVAAVGAESGIAFVDVVSDTVVFDDFVSGCCVLSQQAALACSFSGDTEVVMADGTSKPISEIEVGDEVLAVDPETGQRGGRRVEEVFVHDDTLADLGIDGGVVTTTEDHPFWNQTDHKFERADALDAGDLVLTADGDLVPVDGLVAGSEQTGTAYNLHIREIHTYFVVVDDDQALVHNMCNVAPSSADANVVVGRRGASQTFVDDAGRSSTVRYGGEIRVAPGTNTPGVVNGRAYSGHAFDQMQARGIVPSVVDDTIAIGVSAPSRGGTSVFYGAGNDVSVVVNSHGRVVTVSYGDLRP